MTATAESAGNNELLNFIYQNTQMGESITRQLIGIVDDIGLIKHLTNQCVQYEKVNAAARKMLCDRGFDEKNISCMEKMRSYIMVNLQTLTDRSASHIAEMLVLCSQTGVIDSIRGLKKYKDAEPKVKCLTEDLRRIEEDSAQRLLEFV